MPQPCTVCHHPKVDEINAALVGGSPRLRLARTFGLKEPAMRYHAGHHLPEHLGLVNSARRVSAAEQLLGRVQRTVDRLEAVVTRSEAAEDWRTMLLAARELRPWLELIEKMRDVHGRTKEQGPGVHDSHSLAQEA